MTNISRLTRISEVRHNILFLSHSSSLTGAPIMLYNIAVHLDHSKYQSRYVLPEEGPLSEQFRSLGPTYIEPLFPPELKYWRELKRASRRISFLRKIKPDLVYCNTIHPAKWLVYARLLGIPTLTHVHELSMAFGGLSGLEHFFIKRYSQRFVAASHAVKRYLIDVQGVQAEKICVVHESIRVGQFGVGEKAREIISTLGLENHIVIGTVGRITYVKGSDLFLRLAKKIKQALPQQPIKFLVIATTEDREFFQAFMTLRDGLQLRDDVLLLENIRDVAKYYSIMDIYVSAAREDPFPLVILEAMASRLPIVAFAIGGIPEAIRPGSGILIDDLNIDAMLDAIVALIDDLALRKTLGQAARRRVEEHFDISKNVHQIDNIIESVIHGNIKVRGQKS